MEAEVGPMSLRSSGLRQMTGEAKSGVSCLDGQIPVPAKSGIGAFDGPL